MNNDELLDKLKNFINDVSFQQVKLLKVNFEASENLSGVYQDGMINRQWAFNSTQMSIGKTYDNKGNEMTVASGSYTFNLTEKLVEGEEVEKLKESKSPGELEIKYELNYKLILFLKNETIFMKESDDIKKEILKAFYERSGKIIVFPYIRHLVDTLSREAGFLTPSIPPLIF